jgi:hypothetical protein
MRERLSNLINQSDVLCDTCGESTSSYCAEAIADYLIKSGVIVPPCNVGDITYIFDYEVNEHLEAKFMGIVPSSVEEITIDSEGVWVDNGHAKYNETAFGDIIFLTREEAEQALAKMKGGAE